MKKMLKKVSALLLAVCMLLTVVAVFSGCGADAQEENNVAGDTAASSTDNASTESNETENETETETETDAPTDVLKVRLGAQPASGQVFQFLAQDKGILEEEGLEVEMVWLSNLSDAASALTAGQVDILSTYGTGGPLVQIANGQEWTIMGGYMIIGETPVFGKPETEFVDLESFRGKKIGITRGGTPDVVLKGILYDAGFDINSDVTFVEYKKNTDVLQAVANGEVDFGATATGHQLIAADLGLEVKMWPDEYWENHSCCRMFGMTDWVNENEEAIYRMLRAYLRAEEMMQDEAVKHEVVDLVVENLDLKKETVESFVLSEHMKYDTDPYKNSVIKMWDKIFDMGYSGLDPSIKESINIEDHINATIYLKALESLIEDYPDSTFFQEKLEQYNANNT